MSLYFQEVKHYQGEETAVLKAAREQLKDYFEGNRKEFKLPLRIEGTDFKKVSGDS